VRAGEAELVILGLDPGLASCGWAIVAPGTGRVVDLGVIVTEPDPAIAKSTDRARRVLAIVGTMGELVATHHVTAIAAEAALTFGHVGAAAAQNLCWGAVIGLTHALGLELVEVVAKQWQRAIVPGAGKVTYALVESALAGYLGPQLERLPKAQRTHAADAVGIGLYAAFRGTRRVA
jgi:Holliday junction resolvasome RuvABC endonuclease subunit